MSADELPMARGDYDAVGIARVCKSPELADGWVWIRETTVCLLGRPNPARLADGPSKIARG